MEPKHAEIWMIGFSLFPRLHFWRVMLDHTSIADSSRRIGELDMSKDVMEWICRLFEEIDEPTLVERAEALSLLMAEAESW